jgi:hypothetical protein
MQPWHERSVLSAWNFCVSCASFGAQAPNAKPMLLDLWSKFLMRAMVKTPQGILINQRKGNDIPIVSQSEGIPNEDHGTSGNWHIMLEGLALAF